MAPQSTAAPVEPSTRKSRTFRLAVYRLALFRPIIDVDPKRTPSVILGGECIINACHYVDATGFSLLNAVHRAEAIAERLSAGDSGRNEGDAIFYSIKYRDSGFLKIFFRGAVLDRFGSRNVYVASNAAIDRATTSWDDLDPVVAL